MGKLEEGARKKRAKGDLQRAILAAVGVTGIIAIALIAPKALEQLKYSPRFRAKFDYRARTAAGRLVLRGEAQWMERDGRRYLRITEKGRRQLALAEAKASLRKPQRRWDGRWRMVVFDIPERRRGTRNRLCGVMSEVGFERLQDSVWVYPYDCEDFIALLKADLRIGIDVLYAIADTIEHDTPLRKRFRLPEEL